MLVCQIVACIINAVHSEFLHVAVGTTIFRSFNRHSLTIFQMQTHRTEKTFMVTKLAFDEGVFINPVIPPACAPQDTLVRVALMATHTKEQIDRAVEKLVKAFKALDKLKQLELNDDKLKKIKEDDDFQAMLQNALEA